MTLTLIAASFTPEVQGYYYSFYSVMALQVFLELGLSQSLVQFASHDFSFLSLGEKGRLHGQARARDRLRSLGKLALRWYAGLAVMLFLLIGGGGHWFFASEADPGINWMMPWWLFCAATALNVCTTPVWFLLEGCNQVANVSQYRLASGVAATLANWMAMLWGANLYACVAYASAALLVSATLLWLHWRGFVADLWGAPSASARSWLREIWPFQWRIAVSWMCGYFTFSFFVPALKKMHGAVVAGQMGMTWQAAGAVLALATAWTQTKAPLFGILISQRQFAELDRMFWRAAGQGTLMAVAGAAGLFGAVAILKMYHPLGQRFLELWPVGLFCIGVVLNQFVASMAVYLRAHKQEPLMGLSIVGAIAIAGGVVGLGGPWGGLGAALAYVLTAALISVPLCSYIFFRKRTEWHRPTP